MRTINLNGYIDEEVWYDDEITPPMLHDALYGENGEFSDDVRIILNSYGGSCNAAVRMHDDIAFIGKQMKTAESSYRLAAAGVKDFDKSAAGLTAKLTLLQEKLGLQQKAVAEYEKAFAAAKEQLQAAQQVNDPDKIREATDGAGCGDRTQHCPRRGKADAGGHCQLQ